jgi:hypothetical protein
MAREASKVAYYGPHTNEGRDPFHAAERSLFTQFLLGQAAPASLRTRSRE